MTAEICERAAAHWDRLHRQERFQLRYPDENVVRFVASLRADSRVLDIGCGCGRHLKLLAENGHDAVGLDISQEGINRAAAWLDSLGLAAGFYCGDMVELPAADGEFDAVIAYGSLYYAKMRGIELALQEIHRVLKHAGRALVVMRTREDYRWGRGMQVDACTWRQTANDTNEAGQTICFLDKPALQWLAGPFRGLTYERREQTFDGREKVNSDWILTLTK